MKKLEFQTDDGIMWSWRKPSRADELWKAATMATMVVMFIASIFYG